MGIRRAVFLAVLLFVAAVGRTEGSTRGKRNLVFSNTHASLCGHWLPLNLTELTGPMIKQCDRIPPAIGRLTNLRKVLLGDKGLKGKIPAEIGLLTKTIQLKLGRNQLTGKIPTEIFKLKQLTYIWLGVNHLTGTVPTQFGSLSQLTHLQLPSNDFTGPIPSEVGKLTKLTGLWFGRSTMNGTIPSELGMLTHLRLLWLWHNNFEGRIPSQMGRLTNLTKLSLSHNRLDGHVPKELSNLQELSVLNLGMVHCDCKLLEWYPEYIANSVIFTRDEATFCTSDSEYDGLYPHVLRVEEQSPCSYVYFAQGDSPSDFNITYHSLEISWSYPYPEEANLEKIVIDNAYTNASFLERMSPERVNEYIRDCRTFNTFNSSATYDSAKPILGFEVKWFDVRNRKMHVVCLLPYQALRYASPDNLTFGLKLGGLEAASEYDISIRAFNIRFWAPLDISYVFAPQSRFVRLTTADKKPTGAPMNLRLNGLRPDEVDLIWDPPLPSESNGLILGYRAVITSLSSGRSYAETTHEEQIKFSLTSFNDLKAKTAHRVEVSARTSAGFGPFSEALNFTTCQDNTKWVRQNHSEVFEKCFAKTGHFTLPSNAALSCASITETIGGVNASFCIDKEGLTIVELPLLPGYWRANVNSTEVLRCPRYTYCSSARIDDLDVQDTPHQYCSKHHRGVFCMECDEGYSLGLDGCERCLEENGTAATVLLMLTPPLAVLVLYLYAMGHARLLHVLCCCKPRKPAALRRVYGFARETTGKEVFAVHSVKDLVLVFATKIRIFLGFLQVLVSFQRTFQRNSPISFGLFSLLSIFSSMSPATILTALQLECYYDFNHYSRMLFATLYPIVVTAFVYLACRMTSWSLDKTRQDKLSSSFISTTLLELFLVYPSVSQTLFETFMCESFADADTQSNISESVLRSDYRTVCDLSLDPTRLGYLVVSAFMIAVYPVGVVVFYSYYLWRNVGLVKKENPTVHERASLSRIEFLIYPYKEEYYWFEVYELVRKLMLTSVVGFVYSQESSSSWFSMSAVVTLNLCLVCIVFLLLLSPYKRLSDLVFAMTSLFLLVVAVQFSVIDPKGIRQLASRGVEVVIYVGFFLLLFSFCVEACYYRQAVKQRQQPPETPVTPPRAVAKEEASKSPDVARERLIQHDSAAVEPS